MLNELLVLGQIPGTNFQITFAEVVVFYSLAVVFIFRHRLLNLTKLYSHKASDNIERVQENRQLSLPV